MTLGAADTRFRRDLDYCYARLLHTGLTYAPRAIYEGIDGAPYASDVPAFTAAYERWKEEVAEPFFSAMKQRSYADQLGIRWWIGADTFMLSEGWDNQVAFAELVRPDGRQYETDHQHSFDKEALATMEADWGDALASARKQNPYDAGGR